MGDFGLLDQPDVEAHMGDDAISHGSIGWMASPALAGVFGLAFDPGKVAIAHCFIGFVRDHFPCAASGRGCANLRALSIVDSVGQCSGGLWSIYSGVFLAG